MNKTLALLSLLTLILGALTPVVSSAQSATPEATFTPHDVSQTIETLGQPTLARYSRSQDAFARNPWDMVVFDGRIYIGSGNSYNNIRNSAAGPIDLWYYDPAANQFAYDFTVPEDQVEHFDLLDNSLFVPGYDKRGSWQTGNIYFLNNGMWTTWDNVPQAVHVYDVTRFQGLYFAAIGTDGKQDYSLVSSADGSVWDTHPIPSNLRNDLPVTTSWQLFQIGDQLYVNVAPAGQRIGVMGDDGKITFTFQSVGPSIYRVNDQDGSISYSPVTTDFYAGVLTDPADQVAARILRPFVWHEQTIYIGATQQQKNHWVPFGLFSIDQSMDVHSYSFDPNEQPYAVLADGDQVFALLNQRQADGQFRIRVVSTCDLTHWQEVLRFEANTFARSFVLDNGDLYFGLGTDAKTLAPESGTILRVKAENFQNQCLS